MSDIKYQDILKYYVVGFDPNDRKVYRANIFNNVFIYESTLRLIEEYIKKKDFEEFHRGLVQVIKSEMMARYQYEISVNEPFPKDLERSEKIDFFYQFEKNSRTIAKHIANEVERLHTKEE